MTLIIAALMVGYKLALAVLVSYEQLQVKKKFWRKRLYKVKVRRVTALRKGLRDVFIALPCLYGLIHVSWGASKQYLNSF